MLGRLLVCLHLRIGSRTFPLDSRIIFRTDFRLEKSNILYRFNSKSSDDTCMAFFFSSIADFIYSLTLRKEIILKMISFSVLVRELSFLAIIGVFSFVDGSASCAGKTMLRAGGMSCQDKQTILDEHNRLRQLVALGRINGQPGAANMMEMVWDDELAAAAQKWADRCGESHDNSRNVRRFAVGQNIARTWTTRPPGPYDGEPNWRRQISGWFNEVQHYHAGFSRATGHYTQLVWGDTHLLGCGFSFYYDPARGYTKNYVCNYGPSGNVLGYQPYQSGQPACGNYGMSYSNKYSGLCSQGGYYHLGAQCAYG